MEPEWVIRGAERLLATASGAMAVVLGYRLLLQIPDKTDSNGRVVLPGGISIYVSRVGPGVFFALFGVAVLGLSIHTQMRVEPTSKTNADETTESSGGIIYSNPVGSEEARKSAAVTALIRQALDQLNEVGGSLDGLTRDPASVGPLRDKILDAKLGLLHAVWKPAWGRFDEFERIVRLDQRPTSIQMLEPFEMLFGGAPVPK
ncbi:MAG: hypothetical protein IAE82_09680 [Opitutaceae bacterium]|nr:hypothetical protein [Opitutaceae bacterium]